MCTVQQTPDKGGAGGTRCRTLRKQKPVTQECFTGLAPYDSRQLPSARAVPCSGNCGSINLTDNLMETRRGIKGRSQEKHASVNDWGSPKGATCRFWLQILLPEELSQVWRQDERGGRGGGRMEMTWSWRCGRWGISSPEMVKEKQDGQQMSAFRTGLWYPASGMEMGWISYQVVLPVL